MSNSGSQGYDDQEETQKHALKGSQFMGVYKPKWETNDRKQFDKAMRAVKRIKEQKTLKEVALHAYFDEIRIDALNRITDQEILKDLGTTFDPFLCIEVIARVDDENLLKEIAVHGSCDNCLPMAVNKIKSTDLLADIVCSNAKMVIIEQAIKQIEDQDVLENAFYESYRQEVRRAIWKTLSLEIAKRISETWCVPENEICERIGAHCNTPGPKTHFIEADYETGFVEHELIMCELCGKPLWSRSKAAAEWGVWEGGYIDLLKWKNWRLKDGMWQAKGVNNTSVRVKTEKYEGCRPWGGSGPL